MTPHPAQAERAAAPRQPALGRFHALAWRWHFYAGLYVVPFLLMLAVTGLVMVFFTGFQTRLGMKIVVSPQAQTVPVSTQAEAALAQWPQGQLRSYLAPKTATAPSWFDVGVDGRTESVAVDPYTASVIRVVNKEDTVFAWAEKIHGTLLIGDVGDRLIEIAAGLGIVLILTGLYMAWPRTPGGWRQLFWSGWAQRGRAAWKAWHVSVGAWIGVILLGFLLSGLAWSGVWGNQFVQPWGSFPATKWDNVPLSDATHASLSANGLKEVPWGLEQTPLPVSGSQAGAPGIPSGQPVNLDAVADFARRSGFSGQFRIAVPQSESGVYTVSADSMSGDLSNPTHDRYLHIDRYSGQVLAEAAFADYSPMAKAMAVGIALHQGDMGLWSAVLNVVFCLAVVFLCVSGIVMWWKRRPAGAGRLVAPGVPARAARWKTGALVMLVTAVLFPLSGAVLLGVLLLDWLVISRLPALKTALS
ncbi:PepSY-associated TM helix domain-containing protein [Hydrogenophaga electricum]|uniref:Membrane protein n=1 Tax=Hydrogenophaga electricum TaxID=1230953 RepID=A0ABQ6CEG3_9BURK|nr:PepSY domain-containing protein [Hydrogenophaga electricum]GLS16716.1 membrane protein [Hydrogenophaga electricum]